VEGAPGRGHGGAQEPLSDGTIVPVIGFLLAVARRWEREWDLPGQACPPQ